MQMKKRIIVVAVTALLLTVQSVLALSRKIGRDIEFPKDYNPARQKAILAVVRDRALQVCGRPCQLLATRLEHAIELRW